MADTITFPPQALDLHHWTQPDVDDTCEQLMDSLHAIVLNSRNQVQTFFPDCLHGPLSSWLLNEANGSKDHFQSKGENIMAPVLKERPQSDWLLPTIIQDDQHKFVYSPDNDRVPEIPSNSMWLSTSSISSDSIMEVSSKSTHSTLSSQWLAYQPATCVSSPLKKRSIAMDPEMTKWLEVSTQPSLPESLDGWLLTPIADVPDLSPKAKSSSNNNLVEMWLNLVKDVVEIVDEDDIHDDFIEEEDNDDGDSFAVIEMDDQAWLL